MDQLDESRNPVEALAEEFIERRRRGERPSLEEYATRYPTLAVEIRDLFPALAMIEDLGEDAAAAPADGRADRGTDGGHRPTMLGDYRILREIGRGGMGVVYEAVQESLGRHVALKILPTLSLAEPVQLERFRREARAAAKLHHTNIVPVFGVGEHGGVHHYAMQYIAGQPLDEVLRQLRSLRGCDRREEADAPPAFSTLAHGAGEAPSALDFARSVASGRFAYDRGREAGEEVPPAPIPRPDGDATTSLAIPRPQGGPASALGPPTPPGSSSPAAFPGRGDLSGIESDYRLYFGSVARIGIQVTEALAHAHEHGILHRDVKPSNILLDAGGRAWVTDFGLAKSEGDALTNTGDIVGTVRYMAPERFRGVSDARGDIYGLGLTLYELLALRPAFDGADCMRLIERIGNVDPPRPRSIDPRVPRDLETIVLKAVEKDPACRYATAAALAEDLGRFLEDRPIAARRASQAERAWRLCRRNPVISGLASTVVAILSFLAVAGPIVAVRQANLAASESEAKRRALTVEHQTRLALYASDMKVAHQAWEDGDFRRLLDRLDRHRPRPGDAEDLRGWEWYYLYERCRRGLETPRIDHGVPLWAVAYSPDGSTLALADADGVATLYDADTRRRLHIIDAHASWMQGMAFSPDGGLLATGTEDRTIRFWAVEAGTLAKGPMTTGDVESFAFSPDGKRLAVIGHGGLGIWDVDAEVLLSPPDGPGWLEGVHAVMYAPGGAVLAAAQGAHSVALLDANSGERVGGHEGHEARVLSLAFSPDGATLATGDAEGLVVLWDVASAEPRTTLAGSADPIWALAFSPDGATLASGGGNGVVTLWDAATGRRVDRLVGHGGAIMALDYAPDGEVLASGGGDGTIRLWALSHARTEELLEPSYDDSHSGGHPQVAAFSPDGAILALGVGSPVGDYGSLDLIDPRSLEPIDAVKDHTCWTAGFSPDGTTLAVGGQELIFCDLRSGHRRAILDPHGGRVITAGGSHYHPVAIRDLGFSPGGTTLATAGKDRTAKLWDVASGSCLATFPLAAEAHAVAFSPDGETLATGGVGTDALTLWDVDTQARRALLKDAGIRDVAFSPDGAILASAHEDGTIMLWDAATGRRRATLKGHTGWVLSVAFAPGGRTLASGGWDATVRLWNLATEEELFTLRGHTQSVTEVAFAPDRTSLVSTSTDDTARVWRAVVVGGAGPSGPPPLLSIPGSDAEPYVIEVSRTDDAPVADGHIEPGEYGGPTIAFDFAEDRNPGRVLNWNRTRTKSPEDLSVRFSSAYTRDALFLAFEIRDQSIDADGPDEPNSFPWENDSVEVLIDGDRTSNDLWWGDRIGSREGFQVIADALGAQFTASFADDLSNGDWTAKSVLVPGGYVIEFEIPLARIDTRDGPETVPAAAGSKLRFNIAVNDVDDPEAEFRDQVFLWSEHPETLPLPLGASHFGLGEDAWPVVLRLAP
ncbi:protein kinase domain-containing protein [Tautonia plasticadhaerens]|uniref:Serine/threonine-protein kinase PrkC n=1 Tax=Tautonia plasticadhaerens TaxID=2527974 RepID=A0A518H849_9BACT|nr:protein kinase [Tautonia plasticadhaerens]QDV36995.1 Serine/threonine-protein kinase PrkC [Tautonia plasticadhaerens]